MFPSKNNDFTPTIKPAKDPSIMVRGNSGGFFGRSSSSYSIPAAKNTIQSSPANPTSQPTATVQASSDSIASTENMIGAQSALAKINSNAITKFIYEKTNSSINSAQKDTYLSFLANASKVPAPTLVILTAITAVIFAATPVLSFPLVFVIIAAFSSRNNKK